MKRITIAFGLLASLVLATESQAEFREVRQTIYGMD